MENTALRAAFPDGRSARDATRDRMPMFRWAIFLGTVILPHPHLRSPLCGDFNTFVAAMSAEAEADGISRRRSPGACGVTQDPAVLAFERRQRGTFNKTSSNMSRPASAPGRINMGRQMLQQHDALLSRIEQQFGVPPEIVVAIWGLETDFGKGDIGKMPVIRMLATMAHDCRRTELFQGELLAALKIVQRGDLPSRDDRRLRRRNRPDAIPAVVLHQLRRRFRRQRPRRSPPQRPRRAGLDREPAASSGFKGGAAFGEGTANFDAMREWNRATIYRKTIGYFADHWHGDRLLSSPGGVQEQRKAPSWISSA